MKNILLLEDDENLNRGIRLKLGKEGYQVFSAYSIAEAQSIFNKENIDLVISDITLPDGNGLDFGHKVREKSNAVLIYLTAMDQEID
ncbi:MAG: response regulator, partial [Dorea sp.]|nr:response regulator [Dorea sp.]